MKKPYGVVLPNCSVSIAIDVNIQQVLEAHVAQRHRFSVVAGIITAPCLDDCSEVRWISLMALDTHRQRRLHDAVFCVRDKYQMKLCEQEINSSTKHHQLFSVVAV